MAPLTLVTRARCLEFLAGSDVLTDVMFVGKHDLKLVIKNTNKSDHWSSKKPPTAASQMQLYPTNFKLGTKYFHALVTPPQDNDYH